MTVVSVLDRWLWTHGPGDGGIIDSIFSFVTFGTCCRRMSDIKGRNIDTTRLSLTAGKRTLRKKVALGEIVVYVLRQQVLLGRRM